MSTATQEKPASSPASPEMPAPHDMENDIDAKSATWWVLIGTVVLFISLWAMVPIFVRIQEEERVRKVDDTPNAELEEVREAQNDFLGGANPMRKSLDQAMRDALKK
ncbi:MAG: hypothetical protein NXI31_05480 [bacterium]|nr:hypothetical protein [bacterium]